MTPPIDDRTRALFARAERRANARAANEEIDRERMRQELAQGRALSYEVVLEPHHGFAFLATVVAPRLALYLSDKKISAFACGGVFVSLFAGEELYFIEAGTFFACVREAEGLDESAWRARLKMWQNR